MPIERVCVARDTAPRCGVRGLRVCAGAHAELLYQRATSIPRPALHQAAQRLLLLKCQYGREA